MTTKRREMRLRLQALLDKNGVFCGNPNLADELTDAAIEILIAPKKPRKPNKGTEYYHLAQAIADACEIDFAANQDMLMAEARRLSKATPTPTPELVSKHYGDRGTWYFQSYFGKMGHCPRPSQIRQTWRELVAASQSGANVIEVK